MAIQVPEFEQLGAHILRARRDSGLSQADLAKRSLLTQTRISDFESGRRQPSLDQLLRIAKALDVSIQRLLCGADRPGESLADLAVELRRLGIDDLWVKGTVVPGAFRRPEEVIALALSGPEPDPRVVEAIPAVLAWNEINPTLLRAHGTVTGTTARIAWLADVTLAIERQGGFPGGCQREPLERFLKNLEAVRKLISLRVWDDLGKPISGPPTSPIWKRWHINYDASLDQFEARARQLDNLRIGTRRPRLAQRLLIAARVSRKKADDAKDTGHPAESPSTNAAARRSTPKARKLRKGDDHGRP
jgi:transcriptional regulator with XRE-family HTH domain